VASRAAVQEQEENIRTKVRELPDQIRLDFFKASEQKLKDPDTYAVLNYIFIAGLHHFYLGKWQRGVINTLVFWVGVFLLFIDYIGIGIVMIVGITVFELYELFRSQLIVQEHNNNIMEEIYSHLQQD